MNADRYLGASWATVHGPSDPRQLAIWALEQGFAGILPGPCPRPMNWLQLRETTSDLPFRLCGLRLCGLDEPEGRVDAGLASGHEGTREATQRALLAALEQAAKLGIPTLILEPGVVPVPGAAGQSDLADPALTWTDDLVGAQWARRQSQLDKALDRTCRALHWICNQQPEMDFALLPSRSLYGVGDPRSLVAIFDDLPHCRLGYWHDASITARRHEVLNEEQGEWLEPFSSRILGISLGDAADGRLDLPPGAGLVDYPLLSSYWKGVNSRIPRVVELAPSVDPSEIPGVHAFLTKFGL